MDLSDCRVTVQASRRRNHRERWGYVIEEPGEPPYVSAYRYSTAAAAQAAGEADAASSSPQTKEGISS